MQKTKLRRSFVVACSMLLFVACGDGNSTNAGDKEMVDPSTVVKGEMTDERDGLIYKTVTIGSQTWMAENLNYETANSFCYGDLDSNCTKYGRLYLWSAVMDSAGIWTTNGKGCGYGKTCSPTYPVRGVCPENWHLPTRDEFVTLTMAVGGQSIAGKLLKSQAGWSDNGTDAFGFSALPADGRYSNGNYIYEGVCAYFWSSSNEVSFSAFGMSLYDDDGTAHLNYYGKDGGFSVRCVKD